MVVWLKDAAGKALRLTDRWSNAIFVASDSIPALKHLSRKDEVEPFISSAEFVMKRENVFDYDEREVLRLQLRRGERRGEACQGGREARGRDEYRIYNADLLPAQVYFIEKGPAFRSPR